MNDLDLWLQVVSRSRHALSRKTLEIEAWFRRNTNRKWHMGYQMVTWPMTSRDPQMCCEAVQSAVLATAWLLVLIEAWTQPLSRCWCHCQLRTDGRSDAHSCSEEKRSCRQRSSMKTSQKQDDTSQLCNSPGLCHHHHCCCCCCCCCHDNDVNNITRGNVSFAFFLWRNLKKTSKRSCSAFDVRPEWPVGCSLVFVQTNSYPENNSDVPSICPVFLWTYLMKEQTPRH